MELPHPLGDHVGPFPKRWFKRTDVPQLDRNFTDAELRVWICENAIRDDVERKGRRSAAYQAYSAARTRLEYLQARARGYLLDEEVRSRG